MPGHVCRSKLLIFANSCKNLCDAFLDTTGNAAVGFDEAGCGGAYLTRSPGCACRTIDVKPVRFSTLGR